MTFDTYYPDNPWSGISTNQREWYDPALRDIYYSQALYNRFVTTQFDVNGMPENPSMTITSLMLPHGNFDPINFRALWMNSSRIDTFARTIAFQRYAAKMAMHKHDRAITYWQQDRVGGLINILNRGLGHMMTNIMDALARNAFLDNAFSLYGGASASEVDFSDISAYTGKTLTTRLIDDIHLGMAERNVPYASGFNGVQNNIICITSPGVVADLQYEASAGGNANAWIDVMKYADPSRIIRGEVGTYHHVRFVRTPRAILYNCGPVDAQTTLAAAANAGDGAPDPSTTNVLGVKKMGQPSGVTNYITVADETGFAAGDYISIHTDRTNDFGVTDGADYRDGTKQEFRIVSIDAPNNRLVLDKPLMTDFATDLGSGVYGYVTKGKHIHTAIFIGGTDGVVMGVNQPPRVYSPPPVDDFNSIFRFSFDMNVGYQVFEPEVFEVWFGAGSTRPSVGPAIRA